MAYDLTARLQLIDEFTRPIKQAQREIDKLTKNIRTTRESFEKATRSGEKIGTAMATSGRSIRIASKDVEKLRQGFNRTDKAVDEVKKSADKVKPPKMDMSGARDSVLRLSGAFKTLIGTIGGVYGVVQGLKATLGSAMKQEMETISMQALFKDNQKAADEFFSFLKDKSIESTASIDELIMGGRGFASMTKDVDTLKDMVNVAERLAMVNPAEGFEGAQFSMRELLSGDAASIKERFNISGAIANQIKELPTMEEKVKALDKALSDMGFTQQYVNTVNDTAYAKWQKLGDTITQTFTDIGMGALEQAKPAIESMTAAFESQEFLAFKEEATQAFATLIQNVSNFAVKLYENRDTIAQYASQVLTILRDIGTGIKNVALFVIEHWSTIKPIILGVVTAFAGFKVITGVIGLVQGAIGAFGALKGAFGVARTAMAGLRVGMLAFPGGWIVAAIAAVVTAGILLYKNWDTVKEKAGQLKSWVQDKWQSIKDWTKSTWNSVKESISNAMENAKTAVSNFFNPLLNFIDKAKGAWDKFKKALSNFKLPKISMPKINMPSWVPGFKTGLERVPTDNMPARLHKDEAVLTASQAETLRKMGVLKSNGTKPVLDTTPFHNNNGARSAGSQAPIAPRNEGNTYQFGDIVINGAQKTSKEMAREIVLNIQHVINTGVT